MKILNIPFISKPKAKSFTKWIAKYLIDENWRVLEEWCELLEWTEIRWKELNKKSWEYYWLDFDKKKILFRKKLMFDDTKNEKLSKEKLNFINNYFYENLWTILDHDSYLTWSNPTWSDYDFKRTPYLIYSWIYNQFMFINFFKRLRISKRLTKKLRFWKYEEISLWKYFELFPLIYEKFYDFNKELFTALNSDEINDETFKIDNWKENKEYIDLILSPEYKIEIKDEKEKNNERITKLRRIFKNKLRNTPPSDHLFRKFPEDMCEAAHIFPVSEIKKLDLKYWYMIADENNWLNLPKQVHDLYDNYKIYFDENWKVIFTNNKYEDLLKQMFWNNSYGILKDLLNEKRKDYIKKYNNEVLKVN